MGIWDQKINANAYDFVCGKCYGTDFYVGTQTMSQGRSNTFTKSVETAMCRNCDIQMRATMKKKVVQWNWILLAIGIVGIFFVFLG